MQDALTKFRPGESPDATIPPAAAPLPADRAAAPEAEADWHRPMLRLYAERAMELAEHAQRQAIRQASADLPQPAPAQIHVQADPPETYPHTNISIQTNAGLLFTRLGGAIRQTIVLDAERAGELQATAKTNYTASREADRSPEAIARRQRHRHAKLLVMGKLYETIDAAGGVRDQERRRQDITERLDDEDLADDIDEFTPAEMASRLCDALQIRIVLTNWTDDEIGMSPDEYPPARPTWNAAENPNDNQAGAAPPRGSQTPYPQPLPPNLPGRPPP